MHCAPASQPPPRMHARRCQPAQSVPASPGTRCAGAGTHTWRVARHTTGAGLPAHPNLSSGVKKVRPMLSANALRRRGGGQGSRHGKRAAGEQALQVNSGKKGWWRGTSRRAVAARGDRAQVQRRRADAASAETQPNAQRAEQQGAAVPPATAPSLRAAPAAPPSTALLQRAASPVAALAVAHVALPPRHVAAEEALAAKKGNNIV